MTVTHVWCGATTDTSAWVRGRVTGTSVRLAVSESEALTAPVYFGPVSPTNNIASLVATGLEPGTRYWYALEDTGVLDTAAVGTFRTHPVAAGERANFVFGAAGDAGLAGGPDAGVGDTFITSQNSNNPVFDTMRTQALAEDWLMFCHLGDLHYRDIATASDALYRTAYDDTLTFNGTLGTAARQGQFFRNTAMTYVWDDHDFGANNSNKTSVSRNNALAVYRERVPHYPLPSGTGATPIYQSWQVGRVLFIASDVRADRDPNGDPQTATKTMLGAGQRAWMESLLATSDAEALVWLMPSRWLGLGASSPTADTWDSFLHERQQLVEMFGDLGWHGRMIQLTADKHSLGICSGPNNPYGRFPVFMLSALDASYGDNDGLYDVGQLGGRQQYGTIAVRDDGHTIALTGTGYINGAAWRSHTAYVHVGSPVLALDYTTDLVPPLEPTDDDQRIVNDVTASREDGGEYRVVEETGPMSVQAPPDGVGTYDEAVTVNVRDDGMLPDQASWRVHLGTVDEARFPVISLNLARNPELADQVAALAEGDRLTISNPPDSLPPGEISQIAEGLTETLSQYQWDISLNASPASPYTVAQMPDDVPVTAVGPDQPNRADTSGSRLLNAVDADDTELVVETPQVPYEERAVWITANPVLNSNPDFATSLAGWTGNGAALARVETPPGLPVPSDWCMQVTPDGVAQYPNAGSDMTAVSTGFTYVLTAWIRCATSRNVDLNINWFDGSFAYLSTTSHSQPVTAGTWAYFENTGTAPVGAVYMNCSPTVPDFPPPSDVIHVAVVQVRRTTGLPETFHEQFPVDLTVGGETVRASSISPYAADNFTRTATNTWGTSDSGHTWTELGGAASDRSVSGGGGLITLPAAKDTPRLQLITGGMDDVEIATVVGPGQVSTGAAVLSAIVLRYASGSAYYRLRCHFRPDGFVSLVVTNVGTQIGAEAITSLTYAASSFFWLRARLVGNTVCGRVWPLGKVEPQRWQIMRDITTNTVASGQVGLSASAFVGNTNVNPVVAYDGFQILNPQRMQVARSLNSVVKSHTAGTAVSLARPATLAL